MWSQCFRNEEESKRINFLTSFAGTEWRGKAKQPKQRETDRQREKKFLQSRRSGSNKKNGQPHQNITSRLYSQITL